jgi:hypothetical protein
LKEVSDRHVSDLPDLGTRHNAPFA